MYRLVVKVDDEEIHIQMINFSLSMRTLSNGDYLIQAPRAKTIFDKSRV